MINNEKQAWAGIILIVAGIIVGIYLGIYICFIKGILEFFHGLNPVNATHLAWGIIRVALSGFVGWITFLICSFIGALLIEYS